MTYEEQRTSVVRERADPVPVDRATITEDPVLSRRDVVDERRIVTSQPSASTLASRVVTLVFGIVQLIIGLRILLLLIDARQGNDIVAGILSLSQPLVGPFEGILRTNALGSQGAMLDLAAIVALVGWTIVELVVLAIVRLGRPGEAA